MKYALILGSVCVLGAVLLIAAETLTGLAEAKLTVRVIDEQGHLISDAKIGISFHGAGIPGSYGRQPLGVDGESNGAGVFTATHLTTGHVGFYAVKSGYYSTSGDPIDFKLEAGRWTPWNPTKEVVLKRIINPVPMYVVNGTHLNFPASDTCSYDLIARDWVSPHGDGKVADFVFHLTQRYNGPADYAAELEMTFSNRDDGIQAGPQQRLDQGSDLGSPQEAPATGYLPRLLLRQGRTPQENGDGSAMYQTGTDNDNYIFRVRSVRSQQGELLSAMYGKIYGQIRYTPVDPGTKLPTASITYYLNPSDQSRSLEFNTSRNLFTKLMPYERPNRP